MKIRQLVLTVAGIAGLVIAFLVGRYLRVAKSNPADRTIWISAALPPQTGCVVNFPVAYLDPNLNQIQWASTDKQYWVRFQPLAESTPGYAPGDPLRPQPQNDTVPVDLNNPSRKFNVQANPNHGDPNKPDYYMYDIYDHDPATNPNNPCKQAPDDRDTGVIVKR